MEYQEAYAKALRLLNTRFLSAGELTRKLRQRGADDTVIEAVLETLRQERFIDDERLAVAVYEYYARKRQYGHRYIVTRLQRRYLPVPEREDVEPFDEESVASELVERRFDTAADPRKVARFLQNRGFSPFVISSILSERHWD